jgi:hypothetical protein
LPPLTEFRFTRTEIGHPGRNGLGDRAAAEIVRSLFLEPPGLQAEIYNPRRQHDIAQADILRGQSTGDADDQEQRGVEIVDQIARGFLGFPVALLDLPQDGGAVATALARRRAAQRIFSVPALVDLRIVRKGAQNRLEFILANRQHANIYDWLRQRILPVSSLAFEGRPTDTDFPVPRATKRDVIPEGAVFAGWVNVRRRLRAIGS